MSPSCSIRRAQHSDALRLSQLAEATFRDAFGAMNTPENMALHCRNSYSETIQSVEISDPARVTLLCEQAERLVGFAQLRWSGAPTCVVADTPGEIQRLYVVGDCHGTGVARALMNACLDEFINRRSDVAWLGVWERNSRAIAFYRKFGFAVVGQHVFALGNDPQRDLVLARPVAAGATDN